MAYSGVSLSVFLLALSVLALAYEDTVHESLDSVLHHYDTLHTDHVNHSYTSSSPLVTHRHVTFHTLGRHFHLSLVHNDRVFSREFGAHTVGEDGELRPVHVDKKEFYHGYLHDNDQSSVTAHISKSGVMTASIITPSEIYHIEPSHHYITEPHSFHMIVYQSSHVKDRLQGSRVDYATGPTLPVEDNLESESILDKSNFHSSSPGAAEHRLRRQTGTGSRGAIAGRACPLILVSDFTVYNQFGRDERGVIVQLVQLMDSIDRIIYRPTNWIVDTAGGFVTDLGVEIRNVTVHTVVSSEDSSAKVEYNRANLNADANDLLGVMRFGNWNGFCLAHLFTNRNFASGLLGLANIASPLAGQTGGICSREFTDHGFEPRRQIIYNTGLTTFNNNGQQMLMSELIRVTGHEMGHNWGSHHDPTTEQCRSRWLMNEYAQDGSQQTHMQFSPCSRSSIGQVLLTKASCFTDPDPCGNFETDVGEVCDAGPDGDDCCTNECRLVDGAQCSVVNDLCCENCMIAGPDVTCRVVGRISVNCVANTTCNGVSKSCPEGTVPAADDTPCIGPDGGGVCRMNLTSGESECMSFCALNGQTPCSCGDPYECVVCCKSELGQCAPAIVDNTTLPLSNGAGCRDDSRVCIDGQCTDETQDLIQRIWSIISNLDINAFGQFVRENIVGFTLIFSIPIWCIGSCTINCCIDLGGFEWINAGCKGRLVKEETDADDWLRDRLTFTYFRRLKTGMYTRLLVTEDEELHETASSKEELLHGLPPGSPVDDTPAPTYTYIQ